MAEKDKSPEIPVILPELTSRTVEELRAEQARVGSRNLTDAANAMAEKHPVLSIMLKALGRPLFHSVLLKTYGNKVLQHVILCDTAEIWKAMAPQAIRDQITRIQDATNRSAFFALKLIILGGPVNPQVPTGKKVDGILTTGLGVKLEDQPGPGVRLTSFEFADHHASEEQQEFIQQRAAAAAAGGNQQQATISQGRQFLSSRPRI